MFAADISVFVNNLESINEIEQTKLTFGQLEV